jgi:hypothetical protein
MPISNSAVPFGCSIRRDGIGSSTSPPPALHQIAEVAGQPAAGHRVELDAHDLLPILQMKISL